MVKNLRNTFFTGSFITLLAFFSPSTWAQTDSNDALLRNLFQNLQNYLGISFLEEREYQSRLRAVPPPYYEQSAKSGNYLLAAENTQGMKDLENFLMGRLIDWNMLQPEGEADDFHMVQQHLLGFCSEEEVKAEICEKGLTLEQGGAADLLVDTLLMNDTLSEEDQLAVWAFIDNVTNPTPLTLPSNTFESETFSANALPTLDDSPMQSLYQSVKIRPLSAEGIKNLAARYRQMALLSTSQNALNKIASDRHIVRGLGEKMGMDEPDASIFAAMKFEATRRYGDSNWHNSIYKVPQEAILRELSVMQAFQLYLDFKRYEQDLILTTLLAAQVANTAQLLGQVEMARQNQATYE